MTSASKILILGCGYTGKRVARRLMLQGHQIVATARDSSSLTTFCNIAVPLDLSQSGTLNAVSPYVDRDTLVLYSLPTIGETDLTAEIVEHLHPARRVVYISTTGVYGTTKKVDQLTAPSPITLRERLRSSAEATITALLPNSLILRPAAIYGPHRGIHSAMRIGTYKLREAGENYVSRIHVDDLATHCIAGLLGSAIGAYPVADELPCASAEIAQYCAELLGIPLPPASDNQELSETRKADRQVDGSAVRRLLGIELRFPDYRVGIPACIAAEAAGKEDDVFRAF